MNKFMDKLYIKALVGAGKAKNELQKMREEDEGLDIIITIILVAVGLVLVGVIAKYGSEALGKARHRKAGTGRTEGCCAHLKLKAAAMNGGDVQRNI